MTGQETPDSKGLRLYPPPSKDFDPFTASEADLMRHGLPLRPDRHAQPGMAGLSGSDTHAATAASSISNRSPTPQPRPRRPSPPRP